MSVDQNELSISADSAPAASESPIPPLPDGDSSSDATDATLCNTSASDPNPVPPDRRGIYTFHNTPKISEPGTPILANQESNEHPFRPDSQLAAVPLRLPPLTDH